MLDIHRLNGDGLVDKYRIEGLPRHLNDAVSEYRLAFKDTDEGSHDRIGAQIALANGLRIQFEDGLADEKQYEEALELSQDAVNNSHAPSQLHLEALQTLVEVLLRRDRSLDEEGSRRSNEACSQFVAKITDVHSTLFVKALCLQVSALTRRFGLFGDEDALSEANGIIDRVLRLVEEARTAPFFELGWAIGDARHCRFLATHQLQDVLQATTVTEELILLLPPSHPRLHRVFARLSALFNMRTLRGEEGAMDRAIAASSEAVKRVPLYSPHWHVVQGNHAMCLRERFRAQSSLEDLTEAVSLTRAIVKHISDKWPTQKPPYSEVQVSNLGMLLEESYAQYGRLELLDEAITVHQKNLQDAPPVRLNWVLEDLGRSYVTRFKAHGRLADLEKSIPLFKKAISSAGLDYEKADSTYWLAEALLAMHNERGIADELAIAASLLRQSLMHADSNTRARSYSLLGEILLRRFTLKGNTKDIEEAIKCHQMALEIFITGHTLQPLASSRLGLAYYHMALETHDVLAVHDSVSAFNSALTGLSHHHPDRATYLRHRAESELLLAELDTGVYFQDALKSLREASSHEYSSATERYAAATRWARVTHDSGRLEEAIAAYSLAITILPELAWVGLEDTLRIRRLSRCAPDLAQDAAACAISLGDYRLAVELSEAARSVLWNSAQDLRADLSRLREAAPELALELAQTSAALEFRPSAGFQDEPEEKNSTAEFERVRIHRLASRRAELVADIRTLPGFARFLVPPTYDELSHAANGGPVAIVNSSTYRCDALLLRTNGFVTLLPLSTLNHEQILQDVWKFQACLQLTKDSRGLRFIERHLTGLLRRLWVNIGEPLCRLVFEHGTSNKVPRVWWCPIGPMSFLPLHACGPHDGLHADIFDLIISSYTPTLSALLRAKTRSVKASFGPQGLPLRMLVICQPEVPGRQALPCALEELEVLRCVLGSYVTALVDSQGSVSRVEELLPKFEWLHISTHGTQKALEPLESSLALHDGPLTLARLAQVRLPDAEFAFLSACHSAKGTSWIPNESMHLAGGLMFAGYKSVVATMWGIADKDAPKVVEVFYEHLVAEGKTPRAIDTAEALHVALQFLRDEGVPAFRWVPFIHLGA